jgi:hypothetical protein
MGWQRFSLIYGPIVHFAPLPRSKHPSQEREQMKKPRLEARATVAPASDIKANLNDIPFPNLTLICLSPKTENRF